MEPKKTARKLNFYSYEVEGLGQSTFEERLALVREAGRKAKRNFITKYKDINNWFNADYDQLYILSFCMRYFLMHERGYDEEAEKGHFSFAPHYLELLQAVALSHERVYSARPLWDNVEILRNSMKEVGTLIQTRLLDLPDNIKTEGELLSYRLRTDVMGYHTAVRNWAYVHQMKQVAEDMASTVRKEFTALHSVDPVEFVRLMYALCHEMEVRTNRLIQRLAVALKQDSHIEIQEKYQELFDTQPSTKAEMERFWKMCGEDIDLLRAMLLAHSDLRLDELFTFTTDEMVTISKGTINKDALVTILDKLSYRFGDLKDYQQEHIILDNPVHDRPFIKTSQQEYFTSIWTTIPHLTLLMLENLVKDDDALTNKYNSQRAKYLEDQVEILFRKSFPDAQIFRGSKWNDRHGTQFENDLLVVIGSFGLVVESKSGTVTKAAKRGAPDRLVKTLRELVEEPSEQALRFIEYLKANKGLNAFNTKSGIPNNVDITSVNYFIPVGVTFYHLGVVGTNLKRLIGAGITDKMLHELAPSISLTDLQIVFELLDSEAQKVHYLQRRREFESQVDYLADELDLLSFYLDNGFNLGDMDNEPNLVLDLSLKSKELDPYFLAKGEPDGIEKPTLQMTVWWKAILARLERIKAPRWLEFSYVLLNMNIGAQEEFEEGFNKLADKVKSRDVTDRHNWIAFRTAKEDRRYIVVGYPYLNEHKDERNDMLHAIVESELEKNPLAKGIAIIGVNIENVHQPYNVLAGHLSVKLFDDQFSTMSAQ